MVYQELNPGWLHATQACYLVMPPGINVLLDSEHILLSFPKAVCGTSPSPKNKRDPNLI